MDEIINIWLEERKGALVENYDRMGLRASGNWAASLKTFTINENNEKYRAGVEGLQYTYYMVNGRRRNKDQTEKGVRAWVGWAGSTFLKKWVADKGININPFAVAYKIARKGWGVPNRHNSGDLVSAVITNDSLEVLNNRMITSIIINFKSDVLKNFKNV